MNNKIKKIAFIIFLTGLGLLIAFFAIVMVNLMPVDHTDEKTVEFTIPAGTGKGVIAEKLEKEKLIRNSFFLKVYMHFNSRELFAGTYKLSKNMSALEILEKIENSENLENETTTITFIEGKRLTTYVKQISENFPYSENEIIEKISDEDYLNSLITKYWFLSNDILNKDIYYALEGYIYPDTYAFKKTSTIEEIIEKTLDNMNNKLSEYKEEMELLSFTPHQVLTLASIVELEGASSNDRAGVAGVFLNRLNINMTLGSDVTTYYAVKKDFSVDLTRSDLNSCNAYNTRGTCVKGLPIGPIASASLESIVASIAPTKHEYLYFVADKNKQTYFSKSGVEHQQTINELKNKDLWFEY